MNFSICIWKHKNSLRLLILLFALVEAISTINYKQLNYEERFKQQRIIHLNEYYFGDFLFENSDSSQADINQFVISGWFFIRCVGMDKNLFSIMLQQQVILTISFSVGTNTFRQTILSSSEEKPVSILAASMWLLVESEMTLISNQIQAQTSIHGQGNEFLATFSSQSQNFNQLLTKKYIILQIGNSSQKPGIYESCAFTKYIYIFWDSNVDNSKKSSYSDDFTALQTQLVWNFDFFYTQSNPNQYLNTAKSMKLYSSSFLISNSQILLVKFGTQFKTDYVNPLDYGGLVITFHFKLSSLPVQEIILFSIQNFQQQIQISIDSSHKIKLNQALGLQISLNQWNQITLIIKTLIFNKAYLIVNTLINQIQEVDLNQSFIIGQPQFGDNLNTQDIQFSHIRYYKGAFLTSNQGHCLLQSSVKDCIICQDSFFINYQSDLSCEAQELPSQNVTKDNIIDWNENFQTCQQGMVYDSITHKCRCMNQYYMNSNNKCVKCPNYCNGCINQKTCIEQDPLRFSNGSCPQGYFDDEYSCISSKLTIYSQNNIVKKFQQPDLKNCPTVTDFSDYLLNDSTLNLSSQKSYSFLISFSYYSPVINDNKSFAFFKDGSNEIFTFSVVLEPGYAYICFEIEGQKVYKAAFQPTQPYWIVIWTDLKQLIILIKSNSQLFYKTFDLNYNQKLSQPVFCVGPCQSSYYTNSYQCGDLSDRPLIFIRNITNPINDIVSLQNLMSNPTINIALFNIDLFSDLTTAFKNQIASYLSLVLDFQNTPVLIHKLKGFGFNKQVKASVQNINISGYYWISFYCTITLEVINSQISLLSYTLGQSVEYFLVPDGQNILIRICYLTQCIDSKYSKLNLGQTNNLFIFMRFQSPFSGGIHFVEFDIICNYLREQIQFLSKFFSVSMPVINLNIGLQIYDTEDFLFYLNLISIDKGDGLYYFDYNPSEKCFIFSQIDQMKCLYYKNNLVNYQGQMITVEECQSFNKNQSNYFIVNNSTRECIDSKQSFTDCLAVDFLNNDLQCVECNKANADPKSNCNCEEGYFLDNDTQICLKCHPICQTCQGNMNNCTKCKNSNQVVPSCSCIFRNQFINENFQCQDCSQKCEGCEMTQDSCLKCSLKRINPPLCQCDNSKYIEINGECQDIICDNKCEKCQLDLSLNIIACLKCKPGRQNSPLCTCIDNYKENPDGTCSPCASGYYLDPITKQCEACQLPCVQCNNSSEQCTFCYQGFLLIGQQCVCGQEKELTQNSKGYDSQLICKQGMKIQLTVTLQQNNYILAFTFDKNLKNINFKQSPLYTLIQIQLSEVPQSYYSFDNSLISENKLTVRMRVNTSFKVTIGTILFLKTNAFISEDNVSALSSYYLTNPIQFQIGPFIFNDNIYENTMASVMNNIQNSEYQNFINFIQQTQILFSFLNSAQPTLLFLFLRATLPPNLYIFYQVFGTFAFPKVVDYQSTDYKQTFNILGLKLDESEVFLTDNEIFRKIGFSNSFLVNTFLVIIKYTILLIIYGLISFITQFQFSSPNIKLNIFKVKIKLLQKINSENETNLLLITISIISQFTTFQHNLWSVRYGYYFAIIFLVIFIISFYYNLIEINNQRLRNENLFSLQFTDRLPGEKSKLSMIKRNYFLIQLSKKYLALIIIFSLYNSPFAVCIILGIIFLLSFLYTFFCKPYKNVVNRVIKILGELIYSTVWFLHVYILLIENKLNKEQQLKQDTVKAYLQIGNIVILLLFIFNTIFLIDILIFLFNLARDFCKKKDQQNQKQEGKLEVLKFEVNKENILTGTQNRQQKSTNSLNTKSCKNQIQY